MSTAPPTYAPHEEEQEPKWLFDRPGWPPSPGITFGPAPARPPLTPRQEWFKDLKLGMFVHWGLDSILAGMPEVSHEANRNPDWDPRSLGAALEALGNKFDAAAWVDLAERAGMRYLAFTTKHHVGFANYDSACNPHNSVRMGPGKDFVRLVADACHRRAMPFVAYLSLTDSRHPDFRPLEPAAWARYCDFLLAQIEELADGYGPLMALWLDPGPWNGPAYRYPIARIKAQVAQRWPDTLCFAWDEAEQSYSSRCYLSDEGMVMGCELWPEGTGPGPDDWPLEVCDTINRSWFYTPADTAYKDVPTLITRLLEVVGRGGNYLLNHGPLPSGEINPEDRRRLEGLGDWLRQHGESIYGTRPAGGVPVPGQWTVKRGDRVWVHQVPYGRGGR